MPYILSLFAVGLPIFYLELAVGQFASLGAGAVFRHLSPLFQGVGWGMICISFMVAINYNIVIAWTIEYLSLSVMGLFHDRLMWDGCLDRDWATESMS